MANFRHSLILDMAGNLARRSRQNARSLQQFSRSGQRSMAALSRAGTLAGNGIDRLGNRYVALATGAAGAGALRSVGRMERRLNRLGVQADVSADEMDKVKQRIFEVANAPDIRVDPSQLIAAVETIVEKTGDIDFALSNIDNIGRALSASGGMGAEVGGLISEFKKFGITVNRDVLANLDTLVLQGKAGAFTLGNLASQGERLVSAYATTGRVGATAVRELGAIVQVARQGTGSAEQAATAVEAVLRTLQDADKIELLRQRGIRVFEPGQPNVMRSVAAIMEDIIVSTKGSATAIGQVFDAEAMRAFNASAAEFQRTGSVESLKRFLQISGDGQAIVKDSARIAEDAAGAWQSLLGVWNKFANAKLTGPIRSFADAVNSMSPEKVERIMNALAIGAVGFGGLLVASKSIKAIGAIRGAFGRRGGVAGAAGAAAGMAGGAIDVRVINFPGDMGGMGGGRNGRGGRGRSGAMGRYGRSGAAGRVGRAGRLARLGSRLGGVGRFAGGALGRFGPMAAILGTVEAARILSDNSLSRRQKAVGAGRTAGGVGGALAGAKIGGALGLAGGPLAPVTAPLGALAGGAAGYFLGDEIGSIIGERLVRFLSGDDRAKAASESAIKLDINVEGGRGTIVRGVTSEGRPVALRVNQGFSMQPAGN